MILAVSGWGTISASPRICFQMLPVRTLEKVAMQLVHYSSKHVVPQHQQHLRMTSDGYCTTAGCAPLRSAATEPVMIPLRPLQAYGDPGLGGGPRQCEADATAAGANAATRDEVSFASYIPSLIGRYSRPSYFLPWYRKSARDLLTATYD